MITRHHLHESAPVCVQSFILYPATCRGSKGHGSSGLKTSPSAGNNTYHEHESKHYPGGYILRRCSHGGLLTSAGPVSKLANDQIPHPLSERLSSQTLYSLGSSWLPKPDPNVFRGLSNPSARCAMMHMNTLYSLGLNGLIKMGHCLYRDLPRLPHVYQDARSA